MSRSNIVENIWGCLTCHTSNLGRNLHCRNCGRSQYGNNKDLNKIESRSIPRYIKIEIMMAIIGALLSLIFFSVWLFTKQ